jgi:hypothetical protein
MSDMVPSAVLVGELEFSFTDATPVFPFTSGLSPFVAITLPSTSEGKNVEIRATPEMMAVTEANSLIFSPIAAVFLDATGRPVVANEDSGIVAVNGGALYMFIIARKVKVPIGARRLIVYSDSKLHGTSQTFNYKTVSYLLPVGNVFIPAGGASRVTALYGVDGKFSVRME